jgi:hypothetical protein
MGKVLVSDFINEISPVIRTSVEKTSVVQGKDGKYIPAMISCSPKVSYALAKNLDRCNRVLKTLQKKMDTIVKFKNDNSPLDEEGKIKVDEQNNILFTEEIKNEIDAKYKAFNEDEVDIDIYTVYESELESVTDSIFIAGLMSIKMINQDDDN